MSRRLDPLSELKSALKGAQSCDAHPPIARSTSPEQAALFHGAFQFCAESQRIEHLRWLALNDLFFLGVYILHRTHWIGDHPRQKSLNAEHRTKITKWYFERCQEVQAEPDNCCDIWCYSHDTEILTVNGWRRFDQLSAADAVATRNRSGEFEWQIPSNRIWRPYVGRMIRLHSKNLGEFLVTPNHDVLLNRMPRKVRYRGRNGGCGEVLIAAEKLVGCNANSSPKIPLCSTWGGRPIDNQSFGGLTMNGDDFCAFMGMWLAEGSVRKSAGVTAVERRNARLISIAQRPASRGFPAFRKLLGRIGPKITYSGGNFQFTHECLAAYLRQFGGALDKYIPSIILNAGKKQLAIFWKFYSLGDGIADESRIYTSSARMADGLMEIVQKLGYSGAIFADRRIRTRQFADGHASLTTNPNYAVLRRRTRAMGFNCDEQIYRGHVGCVTVPNGVVLVRRNGKTIWSGNSREHAKSEIITFALTIQDILHDPNETFGIFSHNRPMAKQFLRLIKTEFEGNEELKALFADILYRDPQRESPKWSVDDGIIVRRTSNTKESTIEAWGLVDGQPTSKRFSKLIYDDIVARDQISEQMIRRTTEELHNSYALTASDPPIRRIIGTPQEIGDTICDLMENGPFTVRVHPAIDAEGRPVFFSEAKLADFKNTMSPKVFALQFLLDPKQARENHQVGFDDAWFQTYRTPRNIKSLNRYILIDPAGKSKDGNSYFAAWVVGLCSDKHYYILDGVLDRIGLVQRSDLLFRLVRQWEPLKVVYEKFAFQSDIEHLHDKMDHDNYRFTIVPVAGGNLSKDERIERLMPDFRSGLIVFPERLMYRSEEGKDIDLIKRFKDIEYSRFPFNPKFRDQLDALSRLKDEAEVNYVWPRSYGAGDSTEDHWTGGAYDGGGGWMSG